MATDQLPVDPVVSDCMRKIQDAISGTDMQVAMAALANQIGHFSVLGAETKGDALKNVEIARKMSRQVVGDLWGDPAINRLRAAMRGISVQ